MITFKVGDKEQHEVSFNYDTMWGKAKILVDGKEQSSSTIMFVGHTPFTLQVGDTEKHIVRIELDLPLFFAIRGGNMKAFVDEKLVKQDHISGNIALLALMIVFAVVFIFLSIGNK